VSNAAGREEVEDGHRPLHRPDSRVAAGSVAHSATLRLPARIRLGKLLDSEHLLSNAQQLRRSAMSREEEIRAGLFEHTLNGHAPEVKALTEEGLKLGMNPMDILFKALIPSLEEVGRRFEKGDFFVPEMLIAARAMQGALVILRPLIAETGAQPVGRYVIGTVKGDIHDIGKNLCVIMLEGAGFEVFDLGVNTPPEKFVAAVEEHKPDVVGFSAFLTTTMPMFKVNIDALTKAGLRDKVHIAVGGAPVTQEYAKHVGADSYAPDASMATRMAKELVGDRSQSSQGAQALEQAVKLIDETLKKG
jgi:methylmalonyl-CoA mutase cobalamin-binding domain/chain